VKDTVFGLFLVIYLYLGFDKEYRIFHCCFFFIFLGLFKTAKD